MLHSARSCLFVALVAVYVSECVLGQSVAPLPYLSSWNWILYVGIVVAFVDGFGIGANDVANSFATSVGSRSLTLKQAVLIGMFTEASGAILLGKNTSETIRGKIIDVSLFESNPSSLALGMLCAAIGSASFVLFATRQGWPISTTHAIVGAITGIGIASFGVSGVDWGWNGIGGIIASWFISPIFAGMWAVVFWKFTEKVILKANNSFETALKWIPVYFFITITFISFFMVYKGMPAIDVVGSVGDGGAVGISLGIGVFFALLAYLWYVPWIRARTEKKFAAQTQTDKKEETTHRSTKHGNGNGNGVTEGLLNHADTYNSIRSDSDAVELGVVANPVVDSSHNVTSSPSPPVADNRSWLFKAVTHGISVDVVSHPELADMHSRVPKYEAKTEVLYSSLQILTAAFASFAHGSNDIANAVGPLSTIYAIKDSNWQLTVSSSTETPIWIILLCTTGLDVGLLIYGYNIMRELGNKITYQSPARGFCMELAAGMAVLTASKLGWPVSTTHCITGATLAVGLSSGDVNAVNWKRSLVYMGAWIICVPVSGLMAGLLYSMMAFSPKAYTPTVDGGTSF